MPFGAYSLSQLGPEVSCPSVTGERDGARQGAPAQTVEITSHSRGGRTGQPLPDPERDRCQQSLDRVLAGVFAVPQPVSATSQEDL